jgi:hypothetical protein
MFGNFWGEMNLFPSDHKLVGSVKERAEVWFDKV